MHKLFKRIAVLMTAVIATVCVAAFAAACTDTDGDGEVTYATDTFVVTVLDENGNAIDGTTFGDNGYGGTQVCIQFCVVNPDGTGDLSACYQPDNVNSEGKATISLSKLKAEKVELHVLYVESKGYVKGEGGEYQQYETDKIPTEITVTLKKA